MTLIMSTFTITSYLALTKEWTVTQTLMLPVKDVNRGVVCGTQWAILVPNLGLLFVTTHQVKL